MNKEKEKFITFTARIDEELRDKLKMISLLEKKSYREILEDYVAKYEEINPNKL